MNPTIKQSFVYVIHAQGTPRVKLGVTTDVDARLRAIQTGCPYKCVVLAQWPGSPRLERKLHEHFKEHRKHGEWFELPPYSGKAIYDIVMNHETGSHSMLPISHHQPPVRKPYVRAKIADRTDRPPNPTPPPSMTTYFEWRETTNMNGSSFELLLRPYRTIGRRKFRLKAKYVLRISSDQWAKMRQWTRDSQRAYVQSLFDKKLAERQSRAEN